MAPLSGNLAHRARDELHVNVAGRQKRQNRIQLAIAHERLAADDRDVERPMTIDERHDAVDERLPFEIADFPEREIAAEVIVAVGIATGAAQRALTGDFDRQKRAVPREDAAPCGENTLHVPPTIAASAKIPHPAARRWRLV